MRCLITGGAGFVGSNLALDLNTKGNEVTVMDNLVRRGSEFNLPLFSKAGIKFIHGDIRNKEDFDHLNGKFDYIFETAAQPAATSGYDNPAFDITNNYIGCLNVLEYARKKDSNLIFWSTNKVYCGEKLNAIPREEKPTRYQWKNIKGRNTNGINENFSIDGGDHSIYGVSKACADLTCQEWSKAFGMNIIINRFSCLAGPGQFGKSEQGWVTWFVIAALFGLPITLYGFHGKQVRDVLFMPDILDLVDRQIDEIYTQAGNVFNIGGGNKITTSLLECIDTIERVTGKKMKWSYSDEQRKADQCIYISDISKAKKAFDWEPKVKMEEGIEQIVTWVNSNERKLKQLYK
jgi:CDP-paratose 2-epimerase